MREMMILSGEVCYAAAWQESGTLRALSTRRLAVHFQNRDVHLKKNIDAFFDAIHQRFSLGIPKHKISFWRTPTHCFLHF